MRKLTAAIAFAAVFLAVRAAIPFIRDRLPSSGQPQQVAPDVLQGLSGADREQIRRHLDARGIRTTAGAEQEFARLAAAGMTRLPDADLRRRAKVVSGVLEGLPVADCARVGRMGMGAMSVGDFLGAIRDTADARWFARVGMRAALAEIRGAPAPVALTPEQTRQALLALLSLVGPQDAQRFRRTAGNFGGSSDEDACWAARRMFGAVGRLREPAASHLARMLAAPPS